MKLDSETESDETGLSGPLDRFSRTMRAGLPQSVLLSTERPEARSGIYAPERGTRSESREALHRRTVQDIARARFGFPTMKYPHYKTYVNLPQRSLGVDMGNGRVAYPDIVVVEHPENYTRILGEIETAETVREDVARRKWRPYADLAPLYLYVPVGKGDEAVSICKRLRVPVVGIRTWRYVVGYDDIEINDHYTVPSSPEEMLPRLLRPQAQT